MNPVIEATDVTKSFENEAVIKGIDFRAYEGSIHAVVGPNGAGKSTFLKILAGLTQATEGRIRIFDHEVQDGAALRQRVHYISPEVNLYPLFRVKDILRYGSLLYDRWDRERCSVLVDAFSLPLDKVIRKLSLGMKMRLRIVLALSACADVLLLDEATNGLDPGAKDQILDLVLQESANRGVTVLMATHQLAEVERAADTVSVLVRGRIITTESVDRLKEHVYEVYTAFPANSIGVTAQLPEDVHAVFHGDQVQLIWAGEPREIQATLHGLGARFIDIQPTTLEKWFESMLTKEGVQNGRIVLPNSPVV
ncbi:ABC transporter ATP-binding protein [Alicyclobacillus ferrooxydans]|uniref:ABC transporter domain-containing protein n=1 Tax=Alicyclobacillus ferrooxydans TaxID=471514 RepID=A0A0P9GVF3_9BACL|nr:ABC transporter ATP-binding protein [Alicyclobacillus ferrooxydans]KPV45242.1 hypothetical protein AN477_02230 [Alicyclobacillus ferrooxydans]